jgi:ferredoxin--NADP+ reductase
LEAPTANATVTRFEKLPGCLFRLWVRPDWALAGAEWHAGQFVRLAVPRQGVELKKEARAYSFVGVDGGEFEFYVVEIEDGIQTPKLARLKVGDRLWCEHKIGGHFTLEENPAGRDLWMIGTGAGIAPFMAMLRHGASTMSRYDRVVLVHQVRVVEHLCYGAEVCDWVRRRNGPHRYVPVLSQPSARFTSRDGHVPLHGHVGDLIQTGRLEAVAETPFDATRSIVMLCGNPEMIKQVRDLLEARGVMRHMKRKPGQIVTERY